LRRQSLCKWVAQSMTCISRAGWKCSWTALALWLSVRMALATRPLLVPYSRALLPATFVARRDRFITECRLESSGESVLAHTVNPGRMEAFVIPGARIFLEQTDKTTRKLQYTWELLEFPGLPGRDSQPTILCGTNTGRPNLIVKEVLSARLLEGLDDWTELKSEVKVSPDARNRLDFCLRSEVDGHTRTHWVEVKNCHYVQDGWGYFPDSVSERAARHVHELAELIQKHGDRATVLFVVQRDDVVAGVRPSDFHDPGFAEACRQAGAAGVQFRALKVKCTLEGSEVVGEVPVDLEVYPLAPIRAQWELNRNTTGWIRSQSGTLVANGPFPHHKVKVRKEAKETKEKTAKVKKERKAGTGSPKTRKRSRQLKKEAAEDSGIENKAVENVSESVSEKPTRKPREGQDAEADGSAEDGDAPAERRSRYFSKRLKAE